MNEGAYCAFNLLNYNIIIRELEFRRLLAWNLL